MTNALTKPLKSLEALGSHAAHAAYASADASADAARKQMLKDCANEVRKLYPKSPL